MTTWGDPTAADDAWVDSEWWTITEPKCECMVPDHRGKPEFWPVKTCPVREHSTHPDAA